MGNGRKEEADNVSGSSGHSGTQVRTPVRCSLAGARAYYLPRCLKHLHCTGPGSRLACTYLGVRTPLTQMLRTQLLQMLLVIQNFYI